MEKKKKKVTAAAGLDLSDCSGVPLAGPCRYPRGGGYAGYY